MTTGTSHFTTHAAAVAYYRPYGYSRAAVSAKLRAGEIHIGPPEVPAGARLITNRQEGRYMIEEPDRAQVAR